MKRWMWLVFLSPTLFLSGCFCVGECPDPVRPAHPTAEYHALLQTQEGPTAARGVAAGVLLSDRQLLVSGTYQGLGYDVTSVRIVRADDVGGVVACVLDHDGGREGTFGDACGLSQASIDDLRAGRMWVYVHNATAPPELAGRLLFVKELR